MSLLLLLTGAAHAGGPTLPVVVPDGTSTLDGGAILEADTGAGMVRVGARSPFRSDLGGELYGGFHGTVGVLPGLAIGVGVPETRRPPLVDGEGGLEPGALALALRYAPSRIEGLAMSVGTAQPITRRDRDEAAWQALLAYGHAWPLARAFVNVALVLPEQGPFGAWAGLGARSRPIGPFAAGLGGWVATDGSAQLEGEAAWLAGTGVEVALVAGPRWGTDGEPEAEVELRLSFLVDPRERHQPGDRDVDGVVDALDDCPSVAGRGATGCPPIGEDDACGCVLDEMDRAEVAAMLDRLRHPVPGRVFVVAVRASPMLEERRAWRTSIADAEAVEEALLYAGVSTQDILVLPAGPATTADEPLVTVESMDPLAADAYAAAIRELCRPYKKEEP